MNQIVITGRLTATPELKQTQNGIYVTRFTVAVPRNYNRKETDFLDVTAWRGEAEFVTKYFTKGAGIVVAGSVQVQKYVTTDGQKRLSWQIVADRVEFSGSKAEQTVQASAAVGQVSEPAPQPVSDDWDYPSQALSGCNPTWKPSSTQTDTVPAPQPVQQGLHNRYPGFEDMTAFDDADLPF